MARIPENEIERLKSEVSVQRLAESAGIELKKSGKDFVGLCPFHADATASLVVTPAKNLWHCFGCGAAGGPIDWIIKKNGVSFRHAVELLRDGSSSLAAGSVLVKRTTVKTLPAPVSFDADDQALLKQTMDYYHDTLKQSPEALAYLGARGVTAEAIEHFRLGCANRTLGLRLPEKNRIAGADIRARLQKIGIYRDSGHEHFNGSIVIPIMGESGHISEVYGRKITDRLRSGTPKHLYLPEACRAGSRGVFNVAALAASKEIILCESLIDALTFWCAGYRNVTTSYGVEGFTDDHLAAFKAHGTGRVLIAYDRDEAGERGAAKVAERLIMEGIECFRIQFPKDMDANDYALKVQPADKSLGLLIRTAAWLGQGKAPHSELDGGAPVITQALVAPSLAMPAQEVMLAHDVAALPASPVPAALAQDIPTDIKDKEITVTLGDRRYRVRGLAKNLSLELLKINLLAARGDSFHVDTLDLYSAKQRAGFIAHAALELQVKEAVLKADLGRVLLRLEQLQEQAIADALRPAAPLAAQMSDAGRAAALALLRAPDLTARILADLATCGLVGEETNKLVGYLAAVSRKLDKPLGIVIQSSSAAGKTSLMDAVLAFVPDEEKVKYSSMTGQSLFYMGETNLKHKALAIVEEEGASRASYALKLLQSEGELTIASTGKDANTGNLITQQYRVEGPVALLVTTTARDIDEELLNRCLVLSVDESRHQTRAIHQLQRDRRTLDGLLAKREREALVTLHQDAQRLLRRLDVLNPYARLLTFPDQTTRLRRDHEKYLTLIDTIAFMHQHQRTIHSTRRGEQVIEYIEVTLDDITLANRLAHDVLGRSLDELPPQTRRLLQAIDGFVAAHASAHAMARSDIVFSRRALREAINWGDTQLKMHLARLVELEYIVTHRTRTNGFDYELVYDAAGEGDTLRFPGLVNIEALACRYDAARSGQNAARSGSGRGLVGPQSAPGRVAELEGEQATIRAGDEMNNINGETHVLKANGKPASYPQAGVVV